MDDLHSVDAELDRLRRRVAELEQELERRREAEHDLRESEERFQCLMSAVRESVGIVDGGVMVDVSPHVQAMFGYEPHESIGLSALAFVAPECKELVAQRIQAGYGEPYEVTCIKKDGTRFAAELCGKVIPYQGRLARVSTVLDISARKRVEEATREAERREDVIQAQAEVLAELSTPLLPILEGVLVLPLIGAVNEERARRVIEAIVHGVHRHRAAIAILDITGVPTVDAHVADTLMGAARTVRMLGATVILTGIRPEVARTFIEIGVDLEGILTAGTLRQGVARAIASLKRSEFL